jgi:Plasmid pRiA4b ORF-3-like protein
MGAFWRLTAWTTHSATCGKPCDHASVFPYVPRTSTGRWYDPRGLRGHSGRHHGGRAGHLHFPCPHPRWLLCPAGRLADLARAGADRRPDPGRPRRRHPLAFGFDDPHLWSFFLSGKLWDRTSEYALLADDPFGDPKQAALDLPISQAPADKEPLFLFDYGDEWHFGVKLTGTGQPTRPGARYPRLVATHGDAPPQYPEMDEE